MSFQAFEKWVINFVGPIQPRGKKTGMRYIINVTKYLTRRVEAQIVKDCTRAMAGKFVFEYVLTRFRCLKVLMSDWGTHFLNETISVLTEEFQVYHQKSTPYHQANGTIEAFNKILNNVLTTICNAQRNDKDVHIPLILWAYRTTCKKLTWNILCRLVYGVEAMIPMEYIMHSLHIAALTDLAYREALE